MPTVVLANDVFKPMLYGTAELLGLQPSYVDDNVVFFPHPTSNLTRDQIFRLVDARIDEIAGALSGTRRRTVSPVTSDGIDGIKAALEPLRQSLRADGATLTIGDLSDGVLQTMLEVGEACEGGMCVMPRDQLAAMIEAMLRERFPQVVRVSMADSSAAHP